MITNSAFVTLCTAILQAEGACHPAIIEGDDPWLKENRVDWREITVEHVRTTAADVDSQRVPTLRLDVRPAQADIAVWTDTLARGTCELMAAVTLLRHTSSSSWVA